jgi:adenine deaminase
LLAGPEEQLKLIETARGERPADLFVRSGTIANVYSGELHGGNVAVTGGRIAYVGEGELAVGPDTPTIDARGMIVCPGYVEAHFHPWVLYNPVSLVEGILPLGTTTIVADNLFFFMEMGLDGFRAMIDDLRELPLLHLWMARLTSQAKFPGEEEMFGLDKVEPLLGRDDVIGTAEITRWPALAAGDPALISGIRAAKALGKIVDDHTGGASEARLQPVAAAGIDADHEAITKEGVLNRLRLGLWTMLRNSSLHLKSAVITEHRVARVGIQRGLVTLNGHGGLLHAALLEREGGSPADWFPGSRRTWKVLPAPTIPPRTYSFWVAGRRPCHRQLGGSGNSTAASSW